jgi:multimeric flavodoxin WrbA
MTHVLGRREALGLTASAALAAAAGTIDTFAAPPADADTGPPLKILGVACSMRPGKTTAAGVQVALAAAKGVHARITTEFLDLGGKDLWSGALGRRGPDGAPVTDDFQQVVTSLRDPQLAGLIIGSPSYYRAMSAQCKIFLERCSVLREPQLLLAGKVAGVLAVGAYRNGGQELVIEQVQSVLLCHELVIVGGKAPAFQGATLWNGFEDDITKDALGMDSARKLGIRVADAALRAGGRDQPA